MGSIWMGLIGNGTTGVEHPVIGDEQFQIYGIVWFYLDAIVF